MAMLAKMPVTWQLHLQGQVADREPAFLIWRLLCCQALAQQTIQSIPNSHLVFCFHLFFWYVIFSNPCRASIPGRKQTDCREHSQTMVGSSRWNSVCVRRALLPWRRRVGRNENVARIERGLYKWLRLSSKFQTVEDSKLSSHVVSIMKLTASVASTT